MSHKKFTLTLVSLLACFFLSGQINLTWVKALTGNGTETSASIKLDAAGNVYIAGYFNLAPDFDPGPGVYTLTAAGADDIFVCKLDANGNLVWAKQMGSVSSELCWDMALDKNNNVYLCGFFQSTCDFDPGPGVFTLTPIGSGDAFVCKLDASGNFIWAKQFGGANNGCNATSLAVDTNACVFAHGSFAGVVDFNPGPAINSLTTAGAQDMYVSKLDANGNYLWAKSMGGSGSDFGGAITSDTNCSCYYTAIFSGTADFDPGPGVFNLVSAGNLDVVVSKLDDTGNFVWASRLGGTTSQTGQDIGIDAAGNVCTVGYFDGICDFDPGPAVYTLSAYSEDAYISKLSPSGSFVWAKQCSGNSNERAFSLALDQNNNIYATGYFLGTADFDPGPGSFTLTSAGYQDIFIWKLDANGNFAWAWGTGAAVNDWGQQIAVDANANVYTTGEFSLAVDFDPGPGAAVLFSPVSDDLFIQKLCQMAVPTITANGPLSFCPGGNVILTSSPANTYTWNNGANTQSVMLTAGGYYSVAVSNSLGCTATSSYVTVFVYPLPYVFVTSNDSLICIGETATLTAHGANTYTWAAGPTTTLIAISPTVTNTYTITGTSLNGCTNTAVFTETVDLCTSLGGLLSTENGFRISPNPGKLFHLQIDHPSDAGEVVLFNSMGQKVLEQKIVRGFNSVNAGNLAPGLYSFILQDRGKIFGSGKIIVE